MGYGEGCPPDKDKMGTVAIQEMSLNRDLVCKDCYELVGGGLTSQMPDLALGKMLFVGRSRYLDMTCRALSR